MYKTFTQRPFADFGLPRTVCTIPSIHGDLESLVLIHDALFERITPGDRIVYHGNYTGFGLQSAQCVDEILTFRRMVLARRGMLCSDFIYLKGQQEQMWQKLMQLHYAPEPLNVYLWMLGNGLSNTLYSYGFNPHDGIEACRLGCNGITKWLSNLRAGISKHAGHAAFANHQQRAAHSDLNAPYPMLFVHAGLNSHASLDEQGEQLWWGADNFENISSAYKPFEKVVRGYDPRHNGLHLNCITATVDEGCGFGGSLVSVGFEADGGVREILEA